MNKQDKIDQLEHELEVESQDSMMKSINKDWKQVKDAIKYLRRMREKEQKKTQILISFIIKTIEEKA